MGEAFYHPTQNWQKPDPLYPGRTKEGRKRILYKDEGKKDHQKNLIFPFSK